MRFPQHWNGGQRAARGTQFFRPTIWVPELNSGYQARQQTGTFTHSATPEASLLLGLTDNGFPSAKFKVKADPTSSFHGGEGQPGVREQCARASQVLSDTGEKRQESNVLITKLKYFTLRPEEGLRWETKVHMPGPGVHCLLQAETASVPFQRGLTLMGRPCCSSLGSWHSDSTSTFPPVTWAQAIA